MFSTLVIKFVYKRVLNINVQVRFYDFYTFLLFIQIILHYVMGDIDPSLFSSISFLLRIFLLKILSFKILFV